MKPDIPVHYCWVQGVEALPAAYQKNIEAWAKALGSGFRLMGWDDSLACQEFDFYARHHHLMAEPAKKADVILLSAQVRYGGLVIGTDMSPMEPRGLISAIRGNQSFVVPDLLGEVYNGGSFASQPQDPRFRQILSRIEAEPDHFSNPQVPSATGPLRWTQILSTMDHGLRLVPDSIAWTRSYWEPETTRPKAWMDPGFAASHSLPPSPSDS